MTQRNFRKLDVLLFAVIVACALVLVLWLAGCAVPQRSNPDPNAHVTVAPDGTMALCTTVRVLPAEEPE